jgi:hypothetical protein
MPWGFLETFSMVIKYPRFWNIRFLPLLNFHLKIYNTHA